MTRKIYRRVDCYLEVAADAPEHDVAFYVYEALRLWQDQKGPEDPVNEVGDVIVRSVGKREAHWPASEDCIIGGQIK